MTPEDREKLDETYTQVIAMRRDLHYHWALTVAIVIVIGWAFKDGRVDKHGRHCVPQVASTTGE